MSQENSTACLLISAAVAALVLSGCVAESPIRDVESPATPKVLLSEYTIEQKTSDVLRYHAQIEAGKSADAKVTRNVIVYSIKKEIDTVYQAFESGFFARKSAFEVETDIFELILSTSATLTNAARAKTNLAALLTGAKGSRLSVDKNVFGEKTYAALVAQMRASRSALAATILEKLATLDVDKYPLSEAEGELLRLFNAGTIHNALIELSTDAGAKAKAEATQETRASRLSLTLVTEGQLQAITAVRNRFNDLYAKKDVATARRILKTLDPSTKDDLDADQVWKNLNAEIGKATDKDYLQKVTTAFSI